MNAKIRRTNKELFPNNIFHSNNVKFVSRMDDVARNNSNLSKAERLQKGTLLHDFKLVSLNDRSSHEDRAERDQRCRRGVHYTCYR